MNFRTENLRKHLEKKYRATIEVGEEVTIALIYNTQVVEFMSLLVEGDFDFRFENGDIIVTRKVFEDFEEALEDYDLFE